MAELNLGNLMAGGEGKETRRGREHRAVPKRFWFGVVGAVSLLGVGAYLGYGRGAADARDHAIDDATNEAATAALQGKVADNIASGSISTEAIKNLTLFAIKADPSHPSGVEYEDLVGSKMLDINPAKIDDVIKILKAQGDNIPGANPGEHFYVPTDDLIGSAVQSSTVVELLPIQATLLPDPRLTRATTEPTPIVTSTKQFTIQLTKKKYRVITLTSQLSTATYSRDGRELLSFCFLALLTEAK